MSCVAHAKYEPPELGSITTGRKPNRIAFVGPRRVGKDTAGSVFERYGYEKASFIAPVKAALNAYLQSQGAHVRDRVEMIEGDLKETESVYLNGYTPRFWMQRQGVFMRETYGRDVFVKAMMRAVANLDPFQEIPFFLTDCRFPNEAEALKDDGWVIIRIERPGLPMDEADTYVTETAHEQIVADHTFVNSFETAQEFAFSVEKWARNRGLIFG